jgi:hypothetical protein
MAKRVFNIEKTEKFQAGMSTYVYIQLDDTGNGKAIIEWKHGEQKEFPVKKGQRLYVNMWGGFPDVQVWEQPKPPKDPIMRFLWEHGFPRKKILPWNDAQFVDWDASDDIGGVQGFTWTKQIEKVKFLMHRTEWTSSMSGNARVGSKRIKAVAVAPGATLDEVQRDFAALKIYFDEIPVVPRP